MGRESKELNGIRTNFIDVKECQEITLNE